MIHLNSSRTLATASFEVALLLIVFAFFVVAAATITRSRTKRLKELAREKYFCAQYARLIFTQADTYVLACQSGALFSALFIGISIWRLLHVEEVVLWRSTGDLPADFAFGVLLLLAVATLSVVGMGVVQFGKALAFSRPNRTLCIIAIPLIVLALPFRPVAWVLRMTLVPILSSIGVGVPIERELAVSPEEINELIEISSKAGQIEEDEREMIQHVFTFSDTLAREVMTPRKDIIAVSVDASLDEVISVFVNERLSRVVVIGNDLDDVKGVIIAKDFLPLIGRTPVDFSIKPYLRPAFMVPNSEKVDDLLVQLRKEALHFAVVLDEHGGVDGVVTLEDLVEEIVGEIFDEHDSPHDEVDILGTHAGELLVDGSTIIDDLNSAHHLNIPKGEYDTIAGFVIHLLGHLPKSGEQARYSDLVLRVEEVAQNRITSVRISSSARPLTARRKSSENVLAEKGPPEISSTAESS